MTAYFLFMGMFGPLRVVLCLYEGIRFAFLVGTFIRLQPAGELAFPWLALITPGALFLLMALFWLLDMARYRVFCPLFLAGKGLSIITTVVWLFYEKSTIMKELLFEGMASFAMPSIVSFLVLGDLLSTVIAAKIMRVSEER
jgi:hypothetical protein